MDNSPNNIEDTEPFKLSKESTFFRTGVYSLLLIFFGCCSLCLANGQVFNNLIAFLVFVAISIYLWFPYTQSEGNLGIRNVAIIACALHVAILAMGILNLPDHYRKQKRFNDVIRSMPERVEQIRMRELAQER